MNREIQRIQKKTSIENNTIDQFQITVDTKNFITANLNTVTNQQNILLSDDQVSIFPTSFDAIVEVRSSKGALLLPRLSTATLQGMQVPVGGMIMHNVTTGNLTHCDNNLDFNIIPSLPSTIDPTEGGIVTWGTSDSSKVEVSNITLPVNTPVAGYVLTAVDNLGNTTWSNAGIGPIITGLTLIETKTLSASSSVTAGDFLTSGGLVAEGTVSAGTLVSTGDITADSDITARRLNLLTNNHTLTLQINPAQNSDLTLTMPSNTGNANQVLATDGFGNLSWQTSNVYTHIAPSATIGFDTLNGIVGTVISTNAVTVNSIISVTRNMGAAQPPLVTTIGNLMVGSIINNESFTVYSTVANDLGEFNWSIINF